MVRAGEKRAVDPGKTPIPNYGRGAFFGIMSALAAAVGWVLLNELSDEFNFALMLAVGWFIGWAVKWGMGTVDRAGVWITLYGTLVSILIGTSLYLGARIHDHGDTVTVQGITRAFWIVLTNLRFLALYGAFVAGACWVGVAVCKEGMPSPPAPNRGKRDEDA